MDFIKLNIDSVDYCCEIDLYRRMTIVKGDSGTGKSTFVERLLLRGSPGLKKSVMLVNSDNSESPFNYSVVNYTTWKSTILSSQNSVIIIDDEDFVESSAFSSYYKKYAVSNNLYLLIFARENVGNVNLEQNSPSISKTTLGKLSYSINCIYKMIADGKEHQVVPMYECYDELKLFVNNNFCLLVEDSACGYEFFNQLSFTNVVHACDGKSSIVDDVIKLSDKYSTILVLFDSAAYGYHIEEFITRTRDLNCDIHFCPSYECFEELLLQTNLFSSNDLVKSEFIDLFTYANKYSSWEVYFESLLSRATKGKFYRQTHHSKCLSPCFVRDCIDCNPHLRGKCDVFLDGDKFEELLKGTKYNFLLSLREPRTDNHHVKNGTMQDMNLF